MPSEIVDALEEYEELKIKAKEIDKRLEELKEIILPAMPEEPINGHKGYFEMKKKTTWKYSPELTQEAEELKKKQGDEVAKGIATAKITTFLQYNEGKEIPTE